MSEAGVAFKSLKFRAWIWLFWSWWADRLELAVVGFSRLVCVLFVLDVDKFDDDWLSGPGLGVCGARFSCPASF